LKVAGAGLDNSTWVEAVGREPRKRGLAEIVERGETMLPGWANGFGRLPGFTNCKPKYRKSDGLFPFVRLHSHTGQQYPMAEAFEQEITTLYEAREQEREAKRLQSSLSPEGGRGYRTYLLNDSEAQPSTRTVPPPPTSLSVSPLLPMA